MKRCRTKFGKTGNKMVKSRVLRVRNMCLVRSCFHLIIPDFVVCFEDRAVERLTNSYYRFKYVFSNSSLGRRFLELFDRFKSFCFFCDCCNITFYISLSLLEV